jgi:hypothetical protein
MCTNRAKLADKCTPNVYLHTRRRFSQPLAKFSFQDAQKAKNKYFQKFIKNLKNFKIFSKINQIFQKFQKF